MEQLLMELARTAHNQRAVATRKLTNGLELMVYPADEGMIVGFGAGRELAQQIPMADLLRRRSQDLRRFGAWLPAVFTDGSLYIVKRVPDANPDADAPMLSSEDLSTALELLA
jgi:hypothetical protein